MSLFAKIYQRVMKQHRIDKGQFGGLVNVFSSSLVILSPFSFIGILALNYDRYIKYWMDLNTFIIISVVISIIYEWLFFAFVYPSMVQFGNRQVYEHNNPMKKDFDEIKATLKHIESQLKNRS